MWKDTKDGKSSVKFASTFLLLERGGALPMAVVWNFCIPQKSDVLSGSDLVEILMLDQQSRRA